MIDGAEGEDRRDRAAAPRAGLDRRHRPRAQRRARAPSTPSPSDRRRRAASRPTGAASDSGQSAISHQPSATSSSADRVIVGGLGLEGDRDRRSTTARRTSTCAASACARSVRDLRVDRRPAAPAARVSVNVELQPREGSAVGSQRHRLHGGRGDLARRALSRRVAARPISASCGSFTATAPDS